ncbi:MAG: hypothetical protein ACK42K_07905 [Leptonema sp. (in: bacteria)]
MKKLIFVAVALVLVISFGYYTTIALRNCSGDFCFYLQADEVLHEKYIPYIKEALNFFKDKRFVEGFLLKYKQCFSSRLTLMKLLTL